MKNWLGFCIIVFSNMSIASLHSACVSEFCYNPTAGVCENATGQIGLNSFDKTVLDGRGDDDLSPPMVVLQNLPCTDFSGLRIVNVEFVGDFRGSNFENVSLGGYPGVYLGTFSKPILSQGAKFKQIKWEVGFYYTTLSGIRDHYTELTFGQTLEKGLCKNTDEKIFCLLIN